MRNEQQRQGGTKKHTPTKGTKRTRDAGISKNNGRHAIGAEMRVIERGENGAIGRVDLRKYS